LYWVKTGAQPTDTCKALLSYKGVLHKDHLDRGVVKGALTQEQADKKFEAWKKEKESKIEGKKDGLSKSKEEQAKAALKAEKEANEKKAAAIAAKMTPPVEEAPVEEVSATEEAPVTEAKAEEVSATEEAPAAEVIEDKKED
jgi:small subunit ribosomal protein S16